ncbi:phosphatase PAP2 family protein [Vulcanimicrobium alpinum]|nr:phosphatase PAP2 family protein [Vulcanimicrobium alpinum]
MTLRLLLIALVSCCAMLVVGALVSTRPPGALDQAAVALRGHGVPLALFFTSLGRWYVLLPIGVLAVGLAMTLRANVMPVLVVIAAQVISQALNALVKLGFHRVRPNGFLGPHEPDLSFPSGHAVTAIVFFVGLAILAWHAPFPRAVDALLAIALSACAAGIAWSRLALGAHYATDVLGGLLLGTATLCAAFAVIVRYAAPAASLTTAVR